MTLRKSIIFFAVLCLITVHCSAQKDTVIIKAPADNKSAIAEKDKKQKKQKINIFSIDTSKPYTQKLLLFALP